jgi:hypothetical protein
MALPIIGLGFTAAALIGMGKVILAGIGVGVISFVGGYAMVGALHTLITTQVNPVGCGGDEHHGPRPCR